MKGNPQGTQGCIPWLVFLQGAELWECCCRNQGDSSQQGGCPQARWVLHCRKFPFYSLGKKPGGGSRSHGIPAQGNWEIMGAR